MTSYSERAKAHLSDYRRTRLGVDEDGTFRGKPYPHILPKELLWLNLVETYRAELREFLEESGIRLNQCFHHLNSSQAACLNLLWPLLNCAGPNLIVEALRIGPDEVSTWVFEKVIDWDEYTNFDLYLELKSGAKTFIEFKYKEDKFGSVQPNEKHRRKLADIYSPDLRDIVVPEYLEEGKFFANYQILRNLKYMKPSRGDNVVFLFPRGNVKITAIVSEFLDAAIQKPTVRARIKTRYLEDVVCGALDHLAQDDHCLRKHLHLYWEKYLVVGERE